MHRHASIPLRALERLSQHLLAVMQMLGSKGNALDLACPASTTVIAFTQSCIFLDHGPLMPYPTGLQVITGMGNAMNLVCQARTALADSIRQTAGWLGHASAQSTSTAKLLQVCQLT